MINLQSHPNIQLFEHIAQVESAIEGLCDWHSEIVVSPEIRALIQKAVSLHDIGKGTEAFQEYIKNPPAYTGDPMDKSHTPMSLLLTLLLSMEEKWQALDAMMISAVVFGHHKALPLAERLREIGIGMLAKTLKRQIAALETEGLKQHCAIDISKVDLQGRPWAKALKYIDDRLLPVFEGLSIEDALVFRLKTQLLFSLLLEADKALLAVKEPQKYLHRDARYWRPQWIDQKIGSPEDTPVNKIRRSIRSDLEEGIEKIEKHGIFSLTAPTGSGKTLLSATWLLKLREKMGRKGIYPKAIIVLPFLSVIDQTTKEYESLLTISGQKPDGSWFLTSHSLSDRKYKQGLEEEAEHFFIDTWRTELIITTYDQFLMTLMDSRTRYQMRFHNLCDSLIIMDEVQSLPCKLWKPLEEILRCLVRIGNSSVLLMSATLPSIISDAKPIVEDYPIYFKKAFNRYKLRFRLEEKLNIRDFCNEVHSRRDEWLRENKRVLITLNTRRSARLVSDQLADDWPCEFSDIPLFFLSGDVTPRDRLERIEVIKKGQPCIVVSTQCIEAGVDIDMDFAIRDFAPFDSLVQIAGRCNRNGKISYPVIVEVVDLVNERGRRYSDMIYDEVHLQVSRQLTEKDTEEKDILPLTDCYFKMLAAKKDTGKKHLERFVRWQEDEPVRELLRGKQQEKYTFLVLEQDAGLKNEMTKANSIEDRWKRREAWRALAGRMAKISISLYAKPGFIPQYIATEYLGQWILIDGFYSKSCGLVLEKDSESGALIL